MGNKFKANRQKRVNTKRKKREVIARPKPMPHIFKEPTSDFKLDFLWVLSIVFAAVLILSFIYN